LISLTMNPISRESRNFWASASNKIDSNDDFQSLPKTCDGLAQDQIWVVDSY